MNANELADKLMSSLTMEYDCDKYMEQAATILRQQQAELDAFKLQYYNTGYSLQLRDKDETIRQQQAEIEALKKDNKELHGIAQRMAMAESDARKSLQWFKDAKERQSEPVAIVNTNCENNIQWNVLKPQSYRSPEPRDNCRRRSNRKRKP